MLAATMVSDVPSDPSPLVKVWTSGPARFLQLHRPQRSNSYTQPMLAMLQSEVETAEADASVRVLVITGAGDRTFCGGADRGELKSRDWQSPLNLLSARVFRRIRGSTLVTIAAVNGAAVGGGLELALACDFRIAATSARFWLPEPELGILPAAGGTEWLPMVVGLTKAKELILAGMEWDAEQARQSGLVSEVVAPEALLPRVDEWCRRIARRDALALRLAKHALHLSASGCRNTEYELLAQALLVRQQRDAGSSASATSAESGSVKQGD
jgi:enoyl-CoA hydratase